MASSRLEKIGTIFTRVTGLLRSGAVKWENKPLWYNVYRAFPPINELTFGAPRPETAVRNIFYAEDKIRAKFQENFRSLKPFHLDDNATPSQCQTFIQEVTDRTKAGKSEEEAFNEVLSLYKQSFSEKKFSLQDRGFPQEDNIRDPSVASDFQKAADSRTKTIDTNKLIADVFKEK